jgi:hypothetical protein
MTHTTEHIQEKTTEHNHAPHIHARDHHNTLSILDKKSLYAMAGMLFLTIAIIYPILTVVAVIISNPQQ